MGKPAPRLPSILFAFAMLLAPSVRTTRADGVNLSLGDLPAGKSVTIVFDAAIGGAPPPGVRQVSNQGTLTSGASSMLTDDPRVGGASDPTVTVLDAADLQIAKVASVPAVPAGADISWTITVVNAGPGLAINATLSDTLPAVTTFTSLVVPSGWSCITPAVGAAGAVSCSNPSFGVGSAVFTLLTRLADGIPGGTSVPNTAQALSSTLDPSPSDNLATGLATVLASAGLSLTKTGPATVPHAGSIAYSVTVTNTGPDAASSVSWSDVLPAGASFQSLTTASGWTCTTPAVGAPGTVSCSTPTLGATSVSFGLVVDVAASVAGGTIITNSATASSTTRDGNPGDETSVATTTVLALADLAVTKAGPATVLRGGALSYLISVANLGPDPSQTVSFSDVLPASTTFEALTSPAGWTCTTPAVGQAGTVSCSHPTLGVGTAAFSLLTRVAAAAAAGTTIVNTATVHTATADASPANDTATASTEVLSSADLSVTATGTAWVFPGQVVTYRIEVTNQGLDLATNVRVDDPVPTGAVFEANSGDCTTPFPCLLGNLGAGESRVIDARFRLLATYVAPATLMNEVVVSSDTVDPQTSNDRATVLTSVNLTSGPVRFYTLPACRLVDTRQPAGPFGGPSLTHNANRTFGAIGNCGIPATAKVLALNVVATGASAAGHLSLFAAGPESPVVSAINYAPARTRANNTVVGLNRDGSFAVSAFQPSLGTVDVIVDVYGYFE